MKNFIAAWLLSLFLTPAFCQNIGIGTEMPLMKLHVSNTDSAVALFENTQQLSPDVSNSIYFKTGTSGYMYTGAIKTIGQTFVDARLGFFYLCLNKS